MVDAAVVMIENAHKKIEHWEQDHPGKHLEGEMRWIVITDRGDTFRARYVVNSTGPLHKPKLADISGMDRFEGAYWHTSRWNWDFTGPQVEDPQRTLSRFGLGCAKTLGFGEIY